MKFTLTLGLDAANANAEALQAHRHTLFSQQARSERGSEGWLAAGQKILAIEGILRQMGAEPEKLGA
jgi:hypothetical protein